MSHKKLSGKALAIQLTDSEIRVAKLKLGAPMSHLDATYVGKLPEGAVSDGVILNSEAVQEAIATVISLPEFARVRRVVFALVSTQIIAETATMPVVPLSRLDKMLEANMDMYFPVDTQNYHLTWQVIEKTDELKLQLWAVPTTMVRPYYTVANACGLSVVAIDYCAHALATGVGASFSAPAPKTGTKGLTLEFKRKKKGARPDELDYAESQAAVAVAEGDTDTELYLVAEPEFLLMLFVQNGQVKLQRMFQCGPHLEDELSEVAMAVDYFESSFMGSVGKIKCTLCGPLAEDDRFVMMAGDILNLPVQILPSLYCAQWTLILGAARTDLDFGVPAMNKPGGVGQINNAWQYGLILVGGIALSMALVTTMGSKALWTTTTNGLESTKQSLQIQAAQNANYAQNYYDYQAKYQRYSSDWDSLFNSLHTYNDNLSLMLEELEGVLPLNTDVFDLTESQMLNVTGMQISDRGLTVNLATPSKEEAAYTIMALRKLQYADVQYISSLYKISDEMQGLYPYPTPPTIYNSPEAAAAAMAAAQPAAQPSGEAPPTTGTGYEDILKDAIDSGLLTDEMIETLLGAEDGTAIENLKLISDLMDAGLITEDMLEDILSSDAETPEELLAEILAGDSFSKDQLMSSLMNMEPEQFNALEDSYAPVPKLSKTLDQLLKDATFKERQTAMSTMLNNDPIAMYRFFNLFKVDMNRPAKEAVLHEDIYAGVWENFDIILALMSGDMSDAEQAIPILVDLLIQNENCLSSTEDLFREDERLTERYTLYLGIVMGEFEIDLEDVPAIDPEDILADILNGEVPEELEEFIDELFPGLRDIIEGNKDNGSGGGNGGKDDDDDDDDNKKPGISDIIDIITGNKDKDDKDDKDKNDKDNSSSSGSDDAMKDLLEAILGGQTGSTGSVPGMDIGSLLPGYTGNGGVPQQPVDNRYHFYVVLGYKDELIQAERERKGLDYDAKLTNDLEVAE